VAGMLSVSLSTVTAHHGVLLLAMVLVLLLLAIEARRYCFFDVYRARVRQLKRNYFAQIFAPEPAIDPDWARVLGQDLRKPHFLMPMRTAMSQRLRCNYFWVFLVLLLAWVLKIPRQRCIGTRLGRRQLNLFGMGPELGIGAGTWLGRAGYGACILCLADPRRRRGTGTCEVHV
jgi:uncharacterized membrane protein